MRLTIITVHHRDGYVFGAKPQITIRDWGTPRLLAVQAILRPNRFAPNCVSIFWPSISIMEVLVINVVFLSVRHSGFRNFSYIFNAFWTLSRYARFNPSDFQLLHWDTWSSDWHWCRLLALIPISYSTRCRALPRESKFTTIILHWSFLSKMFLIILSYSITTVWTLH